MTNQASTSSQDLELAKTFFAGTSALAASIEVLKSQRDKQKAKVEFDKSFPRVMSSNEATLAAGSLIRVFPAGISKTFGQRTGECWNLYLSLLQGLQGVPGLLSFVQINRLIKLVQECVCHQFKLIFQINGKKVPKGWNRLWEQFNCPT